MGVTRCYRGDPIYVYGWLRAVTIDEYEQKWVLALGRSAATWIVIGVTCRRRPYEVPVESLWHRLALRKETTLVNLAPVIQRT